MKRLKKILTTEILSENWNEARPEIVFVALGLAIILVVFRWFFA